MKSVKRAKKEGTQEFFNKNKTKGNFTFNAAPFNKSEAGKQLREKDPGARKSAFMSKLYEDDADLENMKVLGGD